MTGLRYNKDLVLGDFADNYIEYGNVNGPDASLTMMKTIKDVPVNDEKVPEVEEIPAGGQMQHPQPPTAADLKKRAAKELLEYVSGINKTLARNIVAYREENGSFRNRKELLKVAKLGPKAYEQCAGFLRIRGGNEALDNTGVHPESYSTAYALLDRLGYTEADIAAGGAKGMRKKVTDIRKLADELNVGEITLNDIVNELEKPSRDPREDMPKPILRSDVLEIKDLKPGMMLKGTVRNVIDFGAFVDIGVHQDGLVHISELSDRYVKHPLDVVKIGDIVDVRVLSVDEKRNRIQLSMKSEAAKPQQ